MSRTAHRLAATEITETELSAGGSSTEMPKRHLSLARHPESSSDLPMAQVATISGFRFKGISR
jgi:hypothetical protein